MQIIFKLCIALFEGLIKIGCDVFGLAWNGLFGKDHRYKGEFLPEDKMLSKKEPGWCLTGTKNLSERLSFEGLMVIGRSGSGKSTKLLIPSLFTMGGSHVVHDPSGELLEKTGPFLASAGYKVLVFNCSKPQESIGYNSIMKATTSSDIRKIGSMLIRAAKLTNSNDPYWSIRGSEILSTTIKILKTQSQEYQNFRNVRYLIQVLSSDSSKLDTLFANHADEETLNTYKSIITQSPKLLSSICSTALAALSIFEDDLVSQITAYDSLDFQQFRREKTALFIQNKLSEIKDLAPLISIFFEQFFGSILDRFPAQDELNVWFHLDECATMTIPILPEATTNIRKFRGGISMYLQDYSQLIQNYGIYQAEAIRSSCHAKVFLAGQSLKSVRELELLLGKYEYKDEHGKTRVRPLMTADEIRVLDSSKAIILCGNRRAMCAKMSPYYSQSRFRRYSDLPPPIISGSVPTEPVPLLPLSA